MQKLLLVFFIGLALRILLIGNPGFIADISFWKSWSLAAADHGIVWTAHNTNINYPPGFIYVLWVMGKVYALFANPHDFDTYWKSNNFLFLLVSKLPAILSDIAIGFFMYFFGKTMLKGKTKTAFDKYIPIALMAMFFLNPITILDSALWGQVESFGMLFTVIAVYLIYKKHPSLASAIFTIGIFMKLQNIIYIPLFFLFIYKYFDYKTLIRSVFSSFFMFIIIIVPFLLSQDVGRVFLLMTVNNDYFPWLSLHAHNPWWLVAEGKMLAPDKIMTIGIINAKTLGIMLFASVYLYLSVLLLKVTTYRNFIASLLVAIFAFFYLTTQSHERYSYPAIIWLPMLIPLLEKKSWKIFAFVVFGLASLGIFFNMYEGLVANYPDNGFAFLTALITPLLSNINVIFLGAILIALFPFVITELPLRFTSIPIIFIVLTVFTLNFSYLVKGKVALSSLKPLNVRQDFGVLQFNRSVNSYSGPKSWNVLSSNYFFYTKGLGTHANSHLVFDVGRKFRRFSTDIGLDSESSEYGSVMFKIYGDDKELFSSPKLGRFDFPRHADVNITGVKFLTLDVSDAGDGINNDHADWLNPVLYK